LNEFVRACALPYLEDDHTEVRRAAALTCCCLFVRDPICYQTSSHATEITNDVLHKLLIVGIADPGIIFRLRIEYQDIDAVCTIRTQHSTDCSLFTP
jgi:phosphatidylinositol kinase/protein kinase (PI-3  family)